MLPNIDIETSYNLTSFICKICWLELGENKVFAELCFEENYFPLNMLQIAIGSFIKFLLLAPCFSHQWIFYAQGSFWYMTGSQKRFG